jgi:MFS family permease
MLRARITAPLGADFRRLWTSSAVSNVGDGVTMVAGPLLVASITTNPAAVAAAAFAQQLPWLLFALISGAWADRVDRRRLVVTVNVARASALALLAVSVATDTVSLPVIYTISFIMGTGETLADTASSAFVPAIVPPEARPRANSLMYANFSVLNQFAAKPLGAWLFGLSAAIPFGLNAATYLASAFLIAGLRSVSPSKPKAPPTTSDVPANPVAPATSSVLANPVAPTTSDVRADSVVPATSDVSADPVVPAGSVVAAADPTGAVVAVAEPVESRRASIRADIAEGVRWLFRHRLLRTLAITMAVGNVVFSAAFSIFVLYCTERLGLTEVGYGVLLTAFAVGGVAGTFLAPRLIATFGPSPLLRGGLLIEVARTPAVAAGMIVIFSIHAAVWGIVVTTVVQRDVPSTLYGRVSSVHALIDVGGIASGSLLGGVAATAFGMVPTYAAAAAAMAITTAAAWRPIRLATRPADESHPAEELYPTDGSRSAEEPYPADGSHPAEEPRSGELPHPARESHPVHESHPADMPHHADEPDPAGASRPADRPGRAAEAARIAEATRVSDTGRRGESDIR